MTYQFTASDLEQSPLRNASSNLTMLLSPGADVEPKRQSAPKSRLLAMLASGAKACGSRLVAALHESRRRQGAAYLRRMQYLIDDAAAGRVPRE